MAEDKKRSLIIKIGCILAAIVLWLYVSNESNTIQTRTIKNIPVRIINEESLADTSLILSPNQEMSISLKVSGTPSKIFSIGAEDFDLIANLSEYILKKGSQNIPVEVLQSPNEVNILNDTSLWVEINVDKLAEKTLPIVINSSGDVGEGYYEFDTIVEPKSITISGAADYVDKVETVTVDINKADATSDITLSLPVKALDAIGNEVEDIDIEPKIVEVQVPIKKTKEVKINVITEGNIKTGYILKEISTQKEVVTIAGNETDIDNITSLETEGINLNEISQDSQIISAKLKIPEGIELIEESELVNVEFTLEKVIEKNITILLEIKNLEEGLEENTQNTNVSIIISGASSIVEDLEEKDIVGYMDFGNLTEGEYEVPVKFELPEGVSLIAQNVSFIKAVISKSEKETQTDAQNNTQNNTNNSTDDSTQDNTNISTQ
ncbi:CdaR family protein [Clostridium sp. DL1XJH146]